MALPEDLDALCTQQLFRAAESSHLEELDDFDLILSQTSDVELSLCTQGLALSPRDEKILLKPLPRPQLLSSTHKERSNRFANPKTSRSRSLPSAKILPLRTAVVYKEHRGLLGAPS